MIDVFLNIWQKHVIGFGETCGVAWCGSFRIAQRRYRPVVDFSLTPMSSRKRKKRSQKAWV